MKKRLAILALCCFALGGLLTGCGQSDASVASKNLSTAADNFQVERRITIINGITDKYLLIVEGKCSIAPDTVGRKLDITCKISGDNGAAGYKKDFVGYSDNVTYTVEQLDPVPVDVYHYKVIFKPETIVPDVDVKTSGQASANK